MCIRLLISTKNLYRCVIRNNFSPLLTKRRGRYCYTILITEKRLKRQELYWLHAWVMSGCEAAYPYLTKSVSCISLWNMLLKAYAHVSARSRRKSILFFISTIVSLSPSSTYIGAWNLASSTSFCSQFSCCCHAILLALLLTMFHLTNVKVKLWIFSLNLSDINFTHYLLVMTAANRRRFAAFVLADVSGSKTFPFLHEGFRRKQLRQIQ